MRGISKVLLGAATAALALTALGAPASAADTSGTLAIVQGYPGVRVDICIGGKEQRSGAKYGSVYRKDVIGTGAKLLRFFKYNPNRTCGGTLIAKKTLNVTPGYDQTIVLTKKSPKIVMFDNTLPYMGEIPPRGGLINVAWVSWASAAEFDTNFFYDWWTPSGTDIPVFPAVNPIFQKGDRFTGTPGNSFTVFRLYATFPENPNQIAGKRFFSKPERRMEAILVGTRKADAKFVFINRGISAASP